MTPKSEYLALDFKPRDFAAISYARALAADAVQKAGNGHPGTAIALAPVAYLLYQRHLRHDAYPEAELDVSFDDVGIQR